MNEVFRPAENMRIFEKPVPEKRVCLILDLLFGTEFQKLLRKPEI